MNLLSNKIVKMKKLVLFCLAVILAFNAQAQDDQATLAALKTELAAKKAAADAAAGEAAAVQAKIDALPGWRKGGLGIIGLNLSGSDSWFANAIPNSRSTGLNFALSGFANNIQDKYFWRNSGALNLAGLKFDNTATSEDNTNFQIVTDALQLTSLYGYRLNKQIAISSLGEFRTLFIGNEDLGTGFLNPGYLDIGAGVTWTPMDNFVAVIHPLNYNFIFADDSFDFESSLGAKLVVDYSQALPGGLAWKSNLSGFLSYKDVQQLSNMTWTNGISFTAFKGIGVSVEYALRSNRQEAQKIGGLEGNQLQQYYIVGLSYSL